MEGRSGSGLEAFLKSGMESMTPERVFAAIGFVTVGMFFADRCYALYSAAKQANELTLEDYELSEKRLGHIQELSAQAEVSRNKDSLGAALDEINCAIREYHQLTAKREAAELTTNKKKYAALLLRRAEIYYIQGNYKRAESDLHKALENDSSLVIAYNFLLHLYVDITELRNPARAKECLRLSLVGNDVQTYANYYAAVMNGKNPDMERVNQLAQQLILDLKNPDCPTRSTIPSLTVAVMMARCMQSNINQAKNPYALQRCVTELLSIQDLVVNEKLRLTLTESIVRVRLKMAQLMNEASLLSENDVEELTRLSYVDNITNGAVGCLESPHMLPIQVINTLIKPDTCEEYLSKQAHQGALGGVILDFADAGMFDDEEYTALKNVCQELSSANAEEQPILEKAIRLFIDYVKKQGLDVWTNAVFDSTMQQFSASLFNIACAEAHLNMKIYLSDNSRTLTCQRELRYQPDTEEHDKNKVLNVVFDSQQNRLRVMWDLNTPAVKQQFLALKECERVLAKNPDNAVFLDLLTQAGFVMANRRAAVQQASTSIFSRVAYPLLALGLGAATVFGVTMLRKQ